MTRGDGWMTEAHRVASDPSPPVPPHAGQLATQIAPSGLLFYDGWAPAEALNPSLGTVE